MAAARPRGVSHECHPAAACSEHMGAVYEWHRVPKPRANTAKSPESAKHCTSGFSSAGAVADATGPYESTDPLAAGARKVFDTTRNSSQT